MHSVCKLEQLLQSLSSLSQVESKPTTHPLQAIVRDWMNASEWVIHLFVELRISPETKGVQNAQQLMNFVSDTSVKSRKRGREIPFPGRENATPKRIDVLFFLLSFVNVTCR